MGKAKKQSSFEPTRKNIRPALTPEARENQMISLAVDLAEQQLLNGTASSQVITHYLKLGTTRERLEKEKLERENELLVAKVKNLQTEERKEALYEEALKAFRTYNGQVETDEDQDIF